MKCQRDVALLLDLAAEPGVDWARLADIGTFVAALANVGLVSFAVFQLVLLRRQVRLASDQTAATKATVEVARDSAAVARSAVLEAARIRVDEHAPRVIALMEDPAWPPLVDSTRSAMPNAGDLRLLNHRSLAASRDATPATPFVFDGQREWFMWFKMRGVLINEGSGTARVRLDGEAQFVEGSSELLPTSGSTMPPPPAVGTPDRNEYLLRPGQSAVFEWGYGHTLGEWADAFENPSPPNPRGACFLTVTVMDYFEHGVIDHIFIEMAGRPIRPIPGALGQWGVPEDRSQAELGIVVYPLQRTYRSEGWNGLEPPWAEVYKPWSDKNQPS
ncbi:hypothetical protein [Lentzea sp. HUAS12]|uniref:hypothetical protein n=1 Tax=Lentzea sp. HUAS12 TaxID=2951806 RepID=UPI0020A0201B|nr:hypothetical protein [Lentzea sp. HUAS12]USX54115.1 hypothetical protein ND450_08450 [Lentzea sp. HUAS12]